MNELEKKLLDRGFIERLPMAKKRREQIEAMFKECEETETYPVVGDAEMQQALEKLWRWFFDARRDAVAYQSYLKDMSIHVNNRNNQVFDWTHGESGELLIERMDRLQHFQHALETTVSLFDEISDEGPIRQWVLDPPRREYSIEYHPPKARDFYRAILKTLQFIGGLGEAKSVLQLVRETAGAQTDDLDFTKLATPHITSQQWRDIANRAARQMTQKGLLIRDSGDWAITREGEIFLEGK